MLFRQLFDPESSTYTYLIADPETGDAVLVDSVREQVDRDLKLLQELGLNLRYCLETHIHADHITGAAQLREKTGCLAIFPEKAENECAERKIADGEVLKVGGIEIEAIATPGHTPCHMTYRINGDRLLTGDALFIRGCGRTDFQGGDPGTLYDSVTERLFPLEGETFVYPGHDYRGQTRSTVSEERQHNPRFAGKTRPEFIELMNDLDLPDPKKIMEAVPANQHCGRA